MESLKKLSTKSQLLIAVGLFALLSVLVVRDGAASVERSFWMAVYTATDLARPIMLIITQLGTLHVWLIVVLLVFLCKKQLQALQLLVSGVIAYGATTLMKLYIARPRYFDEMENIYQHDQNASGYGFPSGHTAIAVVIGMMLISILPKKYHWPVVLVTVLVAISRLSLGVHAPLDIVGGVLIGFASVKATQLLFPLPKKSSEK